MLERRSSQQMCRAHCFQQLRTANTFFSHRSRLHNKATSKVGHGSVASNRAPDHRIGKGTLLLNTFILGQNGSWTTKDSVASQGSRESCESEKATGAQRQRSEESGAESFGTRVRGLQGTNAGSKDVQATL